MTFLDINKSLEGEKEKILLHTSQGLLTGSGSGSSVVFDFLETHTPTKKRLAIIGVHAKDKQLQKTPSTRISNVPSTVRENLLSRLKAPSKSEGFITRDEHLDFLNKATSVLIFEIENAQDATQMVDISSTTFTLLDKIGVVYLPLYKLICSFISREYEKKFLTKKNQFLLLIQKLCMRKFRPVSLSSMKGSLELTARLRLPNMSLLPLQLYSIIWRKK